MVWLDLDCNYYPQELCRLENGSFLMTIPRICCNCDTRNEVRRFECTVPVPLNSITVSTSGCQNPWRKAAFQGSVTYGTFVK